MFLRIICNLLQKNVNIKAYLVEIGFFVFMPFTKKHPAYLPNSNWNKKL